VKLVVGLVVRTHLQRVLLWSWSPSVYLPQFRQPRHPLNPHAALSNDSLESIHDRTLDEPVDTTLPNNNAALRSTDVGPGDEFKPSRNTPEPVGPKFPLRIGFEKLTSQVLTNDFEIMFRNDTIFYVYEITGISKGISKRQAKSIVKTAMQAWNFLRDNEEFFTSDYLKTIVSRKNLHELVQYFEAISQVRLHEYLCHWQLANDA
jgi:hypothetical protein